MSEIIKKKNVDDCFVSIRRVQQYKEENDHLIVKIEKTEFDLNEYISINHVSDD